jgi:acyl transferase domain-containing protein
MRMVHVQLRMVLEDSHAALEDARGGGVAIAAGSETGVYVACISFEYATVLERGGFKVALTVAHAPPCAAASLGNLMCCN